MKVFWDEIAPRLRKAHGKSFDSFAFKGGDIKRDISEKYGYRGALLEIYASNKDRKVHKWHHYIPLYDRYFATYKGQPIRFLEVGVSEGGSLQLWRKYFGPDAVIFGIDIDPKCLSLNGISAQVRIGSQEDPKFLQDVVREMGGIDIVLDDGSHQMHHIRTTLLQLFPHLSAGGIYVIEDLQTSYWQDFGGGFLFGNNFYLFLVQLIHDMHHWYHFRLPQFKSISGQCTGIHIHDSFVVLEKGKVYSPVHSLVG